MLNSRLLLTSTYCFYLRTNNAVIQIYYTDFVYITEETSESFASQHWTDLQITGQNRQLVSTVSQVDKVLWSGQTGFITVFNLILLTIRISKLTVTIILIVK